MIFNSKIITNLSNNTLLPNTEKMSSNLSIENKNNSTSSYLIEEKDNKNKLPKPKLSKNDEKKLSLQNKILNYFEEEKYELITDIKTITAKNNSLHYICKCGDEKHKSYKDLLLKGCRGCNNKKLKELPTEINYEELPNDNPDEKWEPIEGGFISDKGRACNANYKLLSMDEKGRYYLAGKLQYISILIAKAFKIDGVEKLQGQKSNAIVRVKDKNNINLENISIGTRNEVGHINGQKSKQSQEFKDNMNKSLFEYIQKYKYKVVPELPHHKIFEDGSIYNDMDTFSVCGKRFITFSKSSSQNEKEYLTLCSNNKSYKVHRLICYAFHPIEGLNSFDDYNPYIYQVNHKDGNTLNNHKDNLEWVLQSDNMQHAYDNKLNKKVRPVLQFKLNDDGTQGEFIKEYESLAKASRENNISDQCIRESCKGKRKQKEFFWRYKFEEQNEEWSKKFSSKN